LPKQRYAFRIPKYGDIDPQAVGDRIDELIDEKREHVTDEELIAEARKTTSPLNPLFTFDDKIAAEKWRKKEAKTLIKNLHVEKNGKVTRTMAFEYVAHPDHGGRRVLLNHRSCVARPEFKEQLKERRVKGLRRDLQRFLGYGLDPELRALIKNVKKLNQLVERELFQSV